MHSALAGHQCWRKESQNQLFCTLSIRTEVQSWLGHLKCISGSGRWAAPFFWGICPPAQWCWVAQCVRIGDNVVWSPGRWLRNNSAPLINDTLSHICVKSRILGQGSHIMFYRVLGFVLTSVLSETNPQVYQAVKSGRVFSIQLISQAVPLFLWLILDIQKLPWQ